MQSFFVIGAFIALGVLARRFLTLPDRAPFWINRLIIFLVLPAVILRQLPRLELGTEVLLPVISPWLFFVFTLLAVRLFAARLHWPREVQGALLLLVPLANTSYLGFPMTRAFFGEAGMPYAIVFDQVGNGLLLAIVAPVVLARFGAQGADASWRAIGRRLITFPPFVALCVTLLFLRGVVYPDWLDTTLSLLGQAMAPLAMFIIGLQLSGRVARELRGPLAFALAMKLLVAPMLALLLCLVAAPLFGAGTVAVRVTVFEAAMPTMVTAAIMGMAAGLAPRLCAAAVGLGLGLSLITLPLWFLLLRWLPL